MNDFLIAVVGGLVGAAISPILLDEYRTWRRERSWADPRKKLLLELLNNESKIFRTLETLTRVTGTSPDECRTLLISLGARGALLRDRKEGWALISRAPFGTRKPEEADDAT
jgi:hypothetical protein